MKLNREEALAVCKELWTWLAETGKEKDEWDGWEKYGEMDNGCPFCEFVCGFAIGRVCDKCPIVEGGWKGCYEMGYDEWQDATTPTQRRKYAKIFLERLLEIK